MLLTFLTLTIFHIMTQSRCEPDKRIITTLKYSRRYVSPKIVNGSPAVKGQVPYLVSFKEQARKHVNGKPVWKNLCGGSIIGKSKVVTAAHCFEGNNFFYATQYWLLRVVGGNLRNRLAHSWETGNTAVSQWRRITKVVIHKDFHFPHNDIALVFVDTPWNFTDESVESIKYAKYATDYPPTCIAAGFGSTGFREGDEVTSVLLVAKMDILSRMQCSKLWDMNMDSFICTSAAFSDVATGDSGGPLACTDTLDPEGRKGELLVGVVSGKNFDKTSLFTRLSAYRKWIDSNCGFRWKIGPVLMIISLVLIYVVSYFMKTLNSDDTE